MASDDFYTFSARQRLQQINAGRAQALADLEVAKAGSDYESAALAVQTIADLESQRQSLVNLHNQYVQSQTSAAFQEPSQEERAARTWDRMDAQDVLDLARTSQFGKDLTFDDLRPGFEEVARRRSRGE